MAVAATGELRVVNPATLELVGTVTTTDPRAVQEIVSEAKAAFRGALGALYADGFAARVRAAWRERRALLALAKRYRR